MWLKGIACGYPLRSASRFGELSASDFPPPLRKDTDVGTPPDPVHHHSLRRAARADAAMRSRASRRAALPLQRAHPRVQRSFTATMTALDGLAASGANVSIRVADLDTGETRVAGDDHLVLPIGGLGVVPLLIETADAFANGRLDADEVVPAASVALVPGAGIWQYLAEPTLHLEDLAVLAAMSGDASAANVLLGRVGIDAVNRRMAALGYAEAAILDVFRDRRGPDHAPNFALGTAGSFAHIMAAVVNARLVSAKVSAQVGTWLNVNHDLSLVGSSTGLDPFAHDDDPQRLLFVNKTGREQGVRADAGALAGPRAGAAYCMIVRFDEATVLDRLRVHEAYRVLGNDLMEYVH